MAIKLHLRSTQFEFKRTLETIGCRQLKYFFDVYNWQPGQNGEGILALTRISKKSRVNVQTRKVMQTLLKGLNHPNIDAAMEVEVMPDSTAIAVTRRVYPEGSIRDHIYGSMYHHTFKQKYYKTTPTPFREDKIANVGRQILQGLAFFEALGIPYTHLSMGNIMLTSKGVVKLTEVENGFLKVERFYEHVFREFSVARAAAFLLADINVLAFGCVLYEMSTAMPIHKLEDLDNVALGLPRVADILHKIFHADGKDTLVPTVAELLEESFFALAKIPKAARDINTAELVEKATAYFQFSVTEKDLIKDAFKANTKLVYPDDENLYMKTVTSSTRPDAKMGGFAVVPKPNKTPKRPKSGMPSGPSTPAGTPAASANASHAPPSPYNTPTKTTKKAPAAVSPSPSAGNLASAARSPPPPPPVAPRATSPQPTPAASAGKSALLDSITGFRAGSLKKTVTVDKSAPKL